MRKIAQTIGKTIVVAIGATCVINLCYQLGRLIGLLIAPLL